MSKSEVKNLNSNDSSTEAYIKRQQQDTENEQTQIESEVKELQQCTRALQSKVDTLQTDEKSWYQNASVLVSLLAVLVTVGLTSYNMYLQSVGIMQQEIKERQANVRTAVTNLVAARKENIILMQRANTNDRNQLDILINSQRQVLLEDAKALVDELGELGTGASTNTLLILGYELQTDSDFKTAHSYYKQALQSARTEHLDRVVALRSLAGLRMIPNTGIADYKQGRDYWQQAINIQKNRNDEYGLFLLGTTYSNWGSTEDMLGNKKKAIKLLRQADESYKAMDIKNPLRERALQTNNQKLDYIASPTASISAAQLIGAWKISYSSNYELSGNTLVTLSPDNSTLLIMGETMNRNGIVVQKLSGHGILIGSDSFRIEWQGAKMGVHGPEPLQGSTLLKKVGINEFEGTVNILGTKPTKVKYTKNEENAKKA